MSDRCRRKPNLVFASPGPPPTPAENDALVARAARGDAAARESLIVRNLPLAIKIAKGFYKQVGPAHDIDDLAAEAAVGLVLGVDELLGRDAPPGSFGPFVGVVVKRHLIRYVNARRGRAWTTCDPGEAAAEPAPDRGREDFEARDEVRAAMGTLAAPEARLVRLRFGLGGGEPMAAREAGRVTGMTKDSVVRLSQSAMARMRRRLGVAVA